MEIIKLIYSDHKKWINTSKKFGCTLEEAEDIVSQMYLILSKAVYKGLDISFEDSYNYFYVYRTLKTSFLKLKNKQKKENSISLDYLKESVDFNIIACEEIDFIKSKEIVDNYLVNNIDYYSRNIYQIIESGKSFVELSKQSGIDYYHLYNSYQSVKKELKKQLDL